MSSNATFVKFYTFDGLYIVIAETNWADMSFLVSPPKSSMSKNPSNSEQNLAFEIVQNMIYA